ncbi:MAG TPA: ABC transporter permease [bacterium]|nr:ABC transporter permease [bacterium]
MRNLTPGFGFKFGLAVVAVAVLAAALAPWIAPHDPNGFDLALRLSPSRPGHFLGLDEEGRDLFSLILWGARVSLLVSVLTVSGCAALGTVSGLTAGYFGGRWDHAFTFVTDVILSFPSILLLIAFAAFWRDGGVLSLVVILTSVGWVGYARVVRGQTLSLKERDYVKAAIAAGASTPRIWLKHLVPNLLAPLLVQATFGMAGVILAESTLSFLGLGVSTDIPTWGRLIDQGVQYLLIAPHVALWPGMAMAAVILGFNFLGDGLRDRLDVKEVR